MPTPVLEVALPRNGKRPSHSRYRSIVLQPIFRRRLSAALPLLLCSAALVSQTPQRTPPPQPNTPTRADILRGEYGRYRANNHLLFYHLDVRVDPEKKVIAGKNTIRFKMLKDDTRIQLDLFANLSVDKILMGSTTLQYARELGAVFVDFPETLKTSRTYSIDFYYSGTPQTISRFGGFTFGKSPTNRPLRSEERRVGKE